MSISPETYEASNQELIKALELEARVQKVIKEVESRLWKTVKEKVKGESATWEDTVHFLEMILTEESTTLNKFLGPMRNGEWYDLMEDLYQYAIDKRRQLRRE